MKIDIKSSERFVVELNNGHKYEITTESIVSGHLYVRNESGEDISVEGFTGRTTKLGTFRDIKIK